MKTRQIERQIAKGRRRLKSLRERAARGDFADDPRLFAALSDLAESLEVLSGALDEISSAKEDLSKAHSAAAQQAQRYEDLFRFAPDAYLVTDERGVIQDVNGAAEKRLNRIRRYLIGKPLLSLVAAVDGDRFLACLAAVRDRRAPLDDRLLRFGSNPGWDASISAIARQNADDLEILWMLRDVTERRRAERALRASEARNRMALEVAFDGMLSTDATGLIHSFNTALRQMFGYRADDLKGHAVDMLGFSQKTLEAIAEGSVRESTGIRSDGSQFPIQLSAKGTRADSAAPIVSTVRDMSVQKGLESQLRAASAAMAMAEERERQRLAADLHDDIGQLLSLAGMKLGMLRSATGDAAGRLREEVAEIVTRAHQRCESLTFQLSPPILRDMGLTSAVEWLAEDIGKSYGLLVHVEHDGEPPLDEATRLTVFRSVRELLINAARHARASSASVLMARDGDCLRAVIEDRGAGFDSRSHSPGFGLLSVRERVEALGGHLEIESEIGSGTRASVVVALSPHETRTRVRAVDG